MLLHLTHIILSSPNEWSIINLESDFLISSLMLLFQVPSQNRRLSTIHARKMCAHLCGMCQTTQLVHQWWQSIWWWHWHADGKRWQCMQHNWAKCSASKRCTHPEFLKWILVQYLVKEIRLYLIILHICEITV